MVVLLSMLTDWLIGDPENFPHPIRLMGLMISTEEKLVRKLCKSNRALRVGGFLLVITNVLITYFGISYLLRMLGFNQTLQWIVAVHLGSTTLAAKSLAQEARFVKKEMKVSLERGRQRLRYIVGRNTEKLSINGIIRATVETVAENTSDGIIAPMFFLMFGAPFAMTYKMINTMDSMLGYKNERYQDLGYCAAKLDDLVNLIPARLTALLMVLSSVFRLDVANGFRIILRDHKKHSSPNAGYPESAVAGLLNIELGGGSFYENIFVEKPTIGNAKRPVRAKDIDDTIRIMYRSEILFAIIYGIIYFLGMR